MLLEQSTNFSQKLFVLSNDQCLAKYCILHNHKVMKCYNNFDVVSTSKTFFIVFYHVINLWQTSVTGAPSSVLLLQQQ